MSGFICLYRDAADHPLFVGDAARFGAWFWLVTRAAWKPTKMDVNGAIVTVNRGQLSVSVRHLAKQWGWSKSAVDRFLTRLKTETMIETDSGTGRLVITICNYSKYQDINERGGTPSGTPSGTAAGQQRDTKEQGNHSLSKDKGNSDKEFWESAVSYIGNRGLIGKWVKQSDKATVAAAITDAQVNRVIDPKAYVSRIINKSGQKAQAPVC